MEPGSGAKPKGDSHASSNTNTDPAAAPQNLGNEVKKFNPNLSSDKLLLGVFSAPDEQPHSTSSRGSINSRRIEEIKQEEPIPNIIKTEQSLDKEAQLNVSGTIKVRAEKFYQNPLQNPAVVEDDEDL